MKELLELGTSYNTQHTLTVTSFHRTANGSYSPLGISHMDAQNVCTKLYPLDDNCNM